MNFIEKLNIDYNLPIYVLLMIAATILAAIIGQILGQFLSHILSNRRTKRKYFMQIYQELYSEIIASLSNYIAIKTNPRKYHDVHEGVIEDDLLELSIKKTRI